MADKETSQEGENDRQEESGADQIEPTTSDERLKEVAEGAESTGEKDQDDDKIEETELISSFHQEEVVELKQDEGEGRSLHIQKLGLGEEKEEIKRIASDFFYDLEPLLCKPFKSESCPLTSSVLTLYHSFGYNCHMRCNLHVLDKNTLVFAAGAVLQFVDLPTLTYSYLRTTGGDSVGPIAVHATEKFFAVGETGKNPVINIFSIPDIRLYRILRGGAHRKFSSICFEENGNLLASQAGEPNYMLTIWDWAQEAILLKCKAFSQEVYHVAFNPNLPGYLTTSGSSHIKFWRMARTFTGLKLQGVVGRFGRTSISDVEGFLQFPDGKVLSGSEWGNMLLWEESLIKLQVCRKQRRPCHQSQIYQMLMDEGEIITAGLDGYVRSWSLEQIDQAEVDEESGIIEMEPLSEIFVGRYVQIVYLSTYNEPKSKETGNEVEEPLKVDDPKRNQLWYLQDRAGAIWQAELSFLHGAASPKKLLSFHAGPIVACAVSPITYLVATLGVDGTVRLHDFLSKEVLAIKPFKTAGASLTWVPLSVDNKCSSVMAGFADGGIRMLTIEIFNHGYHNKVTVECELLLVKALKPHDKPVTSLAFSPKGDLLATCSEDKTVFLFFVKMDKYTPFCFLPLPYLPRHLHWLDEDAADLRMRIVCDEGVVLCVTSPHIQEVNTKDTLRYEGVNITQFKFQSIKSRVIHEAEEEEKRKEKDRQKKEEEKADRKRIEDGLETQSQQNLRKEFEAQELAEMMEGKKGPEEPEWEPYLPPVPSPILQALQFDSSGNFWVSMGGYDVGYLYECQFPEGACSVLGSPEGCEPLRAVPVPLTEDVPITCVRFNTDGTCAFYGFQNGHIRLVFLETEFDLSSQDCFCELSVHDMTTGAITGIELSHDEMFLLTIGADGNFFVFSILPLDQMKEEIRVKRAKLPSVGMGQIDTYDLEPDQYTIEDAKQKADHDELVRLAEKNKQTRRGQIAALRVRFQQLMHDNEALPERHRLQKNDFLMSEERVQETKQEIVAKEAEMKRQMAWESEKLRIGYEKLRGFYRSDLLQDAFEVKAFQSDHTMCSYRMREDPGVADLMRFTEDAERAMAETKLSFEGTTPSTSSEKESAVTAIKEEEDDLSKWAGASMRVLSKLKKAKAKRMQRALRKEVWRKFMNSKPGDDYEDPADVTAIREARESMGDFPLKTNPNYVVPASYKLTVLASNRRLAECMNRLKELQIRFNQKLLKLRNRKSEIVKETRALHEELSTVQERLPFNKHLPPPIMASLSEKEEPENRFSFTNSSLCFFQSQKLNTTGFDVSVSLLPVVKESPSQPKRRMTGMSTRPSEDWSLLDEDLADLSSVMISPVPLSPLEEQMAQENQIRLEYEQRKLIDMINEKMMRFDVAHRLLYHDKAFLDVTLKVADLRVNSLIEENLILKKCENLELEIVEQTNVALAQKSELDKLQKQLLEVFDKKNKEMEKLIKLEKALFTQMEEVVGEHNPFHDYLVKVFKMKIKRKRKKKILGQEEREEDHKEEEEEEESSSSESSSEDEDDYADEEEEEEGLALDPNICPNDCSREIYDRILALREERLDLDELKMETKSGRDATLKEMDNIKKKVSSNTHEIEKQNRAFQEFQVEKQTRLNDIHVLALLHPHQLQCLVEKQLPATLDNQLVINEEDLDRLRERIEELKKEKKVEKKNVRDARKHFRHLQYERRHHHQKLEAMIEACDKAMMDKLGRIVEMDVLDMVVADPELEGLRCSLSVYQKSCDLELNRMDRDIDDLRQKRLDFIRMDTERKNVQAASLTRYGTLSQALDLIQNKMLPYDDDKMVGAIAEDIEDFKFLVAQQQMLIRSLNQELEVLHSSTQPQSLTPFHPQFF